MTFQVAGIGEVLWDLLPGGRQLGGAPANFAYHAGALGAKAWVVSRVGDDTAGRDLIARLESLGLATDAVDVDPVAPTGTVTVEVDGDGQPRFTIHEGVAWDALTASPSGLRAVASADAVCFGTLAQRSAPARQALRSLLRAAKPGALRVFDVNLRQHYYSVPMIEESLAFADVLKVNDSELPRLAGMFQFAGDVRAQIAGLAARHRLRAVACTRGGSGSLLWADGRWSEHPGVPAQVADTVGAGDSFTAAMTLGLLAGWDLDVINARANAVASHVASCAGATPELPPGPRAPFFGIGARARQAR